MKDDGCDALKALHEGILTCIKCPLYIGRTHAVPGEGNPLARLMIVGEAPGRTEDAMGRPFVGRAGKLLDSLLASVGLHRDDLYITNCVKCRPPGNRLPRESELDTCQDLWLNRQIELIAPVLVVLCGRVAVKQLLRETGSLKDLHGQFRRHNGRWFQIQYHPAAGLRMSRVRSLMEQDFETLRNFYATLA